MLLCANIIAIALMLATGYAGCINPAEHPVMSLAGFAFPAFMLLNIAFLIMWICLRLRYVLVPAVGFILAYSPVQTYSPLNTFPEAPEGAIKVLSYNVMGFNNKEVPEGEPNPILQYIADADADIVCIQEYSHCAGQDSLWTVIDNIYNYHDTLYAKPSSSNVAIYSKHPILGKEHLTITSKGNTVGIFDVSINHRTVHVINAHLETVGLSLEQKASFSSMVHGKTEKDSIRSESKALVQRLAESASIRCHQADAIDEYVRHHKDESIIFCGDINDHPLSYTHNTIARHLNDCYRMAGHWPGYTMHYNSMHVRIDNIMCSDHWKPYTCKVDKSVNLSDHYPIFCLFEAKNVKE